MTASTTDHWPQQAPGLGCSTLRQGLTAGVPAQDGGGCDGHPTANTHALIAETLQSYITNTTGWGPGNTQTSFLWRSDGGR